MEATAAAEPVLLSKVAVFVAVVRRSAPHLIEASLIPTALFYAGLVIIGLGAAYTVALAWVYAAIFRRLGRGRSVPPLLVLAAIGITVRTTVSLASGSTFLYFAQPVVSSFAMALVFLISVVVGRPMVERLALEFWPLTPEMLDRPQVSQLLKRLTFLWAGVNAALGSANLALLTWLPLTTYVAVKQPVGWAITGMGIAITIDRSVRTARREGFAKRPTRRSLMTTNRTGAQRDPASPAAG